VSFFFFPFVIVTACAEGMVRFGGAEPDRDTWKEAHKLFLRAFLDPQLAQEKKKLSRILKKPLPESISRELFEYDAFLRGLGRMSLSK